ncbi:serpentine type 7TM GPCR chemoreceptor sri domain-containing protein [Ditylenchus destructor]|uniref:Serpentine type 7TM GPCR chemoreceptor sri domain-containing protein n=1 Tax=Ditylenchus destructor TaxID=166010 RepID=A0AAD4QV04_9BILA|nr:serpentine type 7TM GPCR chemoreceptor sri domain-containing protein [Ditylenchus destructor]
MDLNLSLSDIYHPAIVTYYNYSLLLSFCLTTIILIPAIYVVLTQSKKAQMFKYLLLNQLLWSYLFCAIFVLEGNVPLFPIPGIYFSSIMKWFPEKMNIVLPIHLFISVGHTQSYFLACLYKVSYASAFNKLQFWFEDPRKLEAIVGGLLIIFSTIIVGPFLFYNYDVLQLRQVLLDEYPLLHQLIVHEPSVIASPVMTFPRNCTILTVALTAYGLYIPLTFISGFSIYLIFLRQAFLVKDFMNDKTYHNYLVVVHAKSVQICSVSLFLFIPFLIQFIVFSARLRHASLIALLAHFPASYHLFVEIIALFYFVRPYREFFMKTMGKIRMKVTTKSESESQQMPTLKPTLESS